MNVEIISWRILILIFQFLRYVVFWYPEINLNGWKIR